MPDLAPVPAARPAPIAPRGSRRATTMDKVRVRAFARRLESGEDELDAFWAVVSDPGIGYADFRGKTDRPKPIVLRRKLVAILARVAPVLVEGAKNLALARLSGLSDDAVRAVGEVVTGDFGDAGHARARLEAARVILAAIGVRDQSPSAVATAQASASVTVSLADGLRALRGVPIEIDGDVGGA